LPYEITDFQKLSINTLLQKKDLILLSPTGSGKMNVILMGILGLRKIFANKKGVAVVTQPLTAIMNQKLKNSIVRTAVLTMRGKLKKDESDETELSCIEQEVLDGKFPVIIGHPESWGSARGQRLLLEMKKMEMILLIAIDEFHQGQIGHWAEFRPNMMKVISRLRIFRAQGAPCVAMSATATSEEVSATIENLALRTPPVILKASPTQKNIKLVTIKRPPNNNGPDGYLDKNGLMHPGFLSLLERIYLTEFVSCVRDGKSVKKALIFCRTDTDVIAIFNYLQEALPWFKDVGEAPFVQVTSSVGPITESMIEKRNDISLYISTTKMLMGVDIPGIAIVIFLRPLNMVHYIAQGAGRGGRRLGDNSGMRQRVVAYLLWNNSDIGNNVKGLSNAVKEFCLEKGCLNLFMDNYFTKSDTENRRMQGDWCCSNTH